MPVLVHAREDEREALDALEAEIAPFAELERLDAARRPRAVPAAAGTTRVHGIADRNGIRLDPHALLQGNLAPAAAQRRRAA